MVSINETLKPYGFRVSAVGDEWYVSDGRVRMIRFPDGVPLVITGAATELAAPAAPASPGPMRVVKAKGGGAAAARFRPY